MAVGSKSFPQDFPPEEVDPAEKAKRAATGVLLEVLGMKPWAQVAVAYGLIELTLWTMPHHYQGVWMALATLFVLVCSFASKYSEKEMGLRAPAWSEAAQILVPGLVAAAAIPVTCALVFGWPVPANPHWPTLRGMWQYAIWAVVQQFILQSFFFVRMESVLGGRRAVAATAALFAAAHVPSPILTVGTFFGALFFCEMFRRFRNIYLLGVVHAALGLALAESVPDGVIRHMRVGISWFYFHGH